MLLREFWDASRGFGVLTFGQNELLTQYSALLRVRSDYGEMPDWNAGQERRHDSLLRSLIDRGDFVLAAEYIEKMKAFTRKRCDLLAYNLYCRYAVRVEQLKSSSSGASAPPSGKPSENLPPRIASGGAG